MAETALNPILAQAQKVLNTVAPSSASFPLKTVESDSSGTSISNRVTSITQIKSPSATTFESAIDGVNVGMADSARLTPLAIASEKEAASIAGATAEAVVSQSVNSNIIASVQGVAEIQAQLDTKRIFEAAGGVDELVKLATGMKVARDDQFAKQEAVRKNVDVDFSDNPIQWLVNKFTIGALGEEESVATATVQMYEQAIGNISSLASSTDRAINDVKITATVATLAAEKEKISQQATIDAARFKLQAEQSNANQVSMLLSASKERVSAIVDKYKLGLMARSEEDAKSERELRRKALEADDNFEATLVGGSLLGRERLNIPTYKGTDSALIKQQSDRILAEFRVGGNQKEKIITQFELGIRVTAPTAYQTLEGYYASTPAKLTDGSNKALEALEAARQDVIVASSDPQGGFKLTEANMPDLVNSRATGKFDEFHKQIKSTDEENPNRAAPLAIIAAAESVKNEPLVQNLFTPLIAGGVKDLPVEKVIELSAAAIKTKNNPTGTITLDQAAAGIKSMYSYAVVHNNVTQDREKLGLPIQREYNAKLKNAAGFTFSDTVFKGAKFKTTVDLTNEVEIKNALVRSLTRTFEPVLGPNAVGQPTAKELLGVDSYDVDKVNRMQEK